MSEPVPMSDTDRAVSDEILTGLLEARKKRATPEELGAPTDDEIRLIVDRVSPTARSVLEDAARALCFAKWLSGNVTPWRELIDIYRKGEPKPIELDVIDEDGSRRTQIAYIADGYLSAEMVSPVGRLTKALDLIASENQKKTKVGRDVVEAKHGPSRPLKDWAQKHAKSSSKDEARRLLRSMPEEFKKLSENLKDPERLIYDAIRKKLPGP